MAGPKPTASFGGGIEASRRCTICGQRKSLFSDFALTNGPLYGGYSRVCKPCERSLKLTKARDAYLRRTYKLSAAQYDAMLNQQDGACAICKKKSTTRRLAVDHDHATGAVRGLLCSRCNTAVGLLEDDITRAIEAARYLHQHELVAQLEQTQ